MNDDLHFDAPFGVGRTLGLAAGLFLRHFVVFVGISLLLSAPLVIWGYPAFADIDVRAMETFGNFSRFAGIVLGSFATAAIVLLAFQSLSGEKASVGTALGLTAKKLPTLLGASILLSLAIGGGLILLVVPGLVFATRLSVVIPAVMCEGTGAVDALTRSNELVTGYGGQVFGIIVVAYLPTIGFGLVALDMLKSGTMSFATYFLVAMALEVLQRAFSGACSAATYTELRRVKEGVESDALLDVFA